MLWEHEKGKMICLAMKDLKVRVFKRWASPFALALALALALAGCGGGEGALPAAASPGMAAPGAPPALLTYLQAPREGLLAQSDDGQAYTVQLNTRAFHALREGDTFEVRVPGVGPLVVTVQQRETHMDGRIVVLSGTVPGWGFSLVRLSASGDAVSGSVALDRASWQIRSTAQGTTLQNQRAAGGTELPSHAPQAARQRAQAYALPAARSQRDKPQAATATQMATIRLQFLGDLSYQALMGSEASQLADLGNIVSVANQALSNSNAFVRFDMLGGYTRLNTSFSNLTNDTVLNQLQAGTGALAGQWPTQISSGRDVTVALSAFNNTKGSTCGIAPLGQYNGNQFSNAVPSGVALSRGTRSSDRGFCSDDTLAHELGHVMGAAHDRANSGGAGAFPYSFGFGIEGVFGDVMSYLSPRVPYFSTPLVTQCAGRACGTVNDDAVRTFNNTAPEVAAAGDADNRLSGWYLDKNAQGTGWAIEVANGKAFVAAFVYADNGLPTWVVGVGAPCVDRPAVMCVGLDEYVGGQTLVGAHREHRVNRRVADAELTFSSGYPATVQVRMGNVVRNMERFVFSTGGLTTAPSSPGATVPGWYYNAAAQGTGVFVERQNDTIFAAYFYYREDGSPTWSIVTGRNWLPDAASGGHISNALDFQGFQGGQTLTGSFRSNTALPGSEAQTLLNVDTGLFTVLNANGSRSGEVWSKFSF